MNRFEEYERLREETFRSQMIPDLPTEPALIGHTFDEDFRRSNQGVLDFMEMLRLPAWFLHELNDRVAYHEQEKVNWAKDGF